ncbi:Bromodomain-containing protein 8 [Chionoecetes opilio]|uniref:Bromodomain-containing protein 8 n=1 Tax=Chionoecetes opilio TaxID=41210 RepID=A0A8J4YR00_CHIOP|nr:Bromodomain-containing protein 8 [Chionoecetes opilio]
MILWNDIAAHKFASLFLRPITDDQAPGYHSVVYRAMDLQKIKRNIESGAIRTTAEFQRDMMLMFLNATMYNTRDHNVYQLAHQMMKDAVSCIQASLLLLLVTFVA